MRVARPPARMTTGISSELSVVGYDSCAFEFKPKPDFLQTLLAQSVTQPGFVFSIEHQKTTAAGSDQLAARSSVGESTFVPLVDFAVAHSGTATLLVLPMNVHQPAELRDISL